jgi:hypothetical protein
MTTPFNPRTDRQRRLARFLRVSVAGAFVIAVGALVLPGRVGTVFGVAMVVVLVAVPLIRLAWLARRWLRKGDRRFALVAVLLAGIVAAGAFLGR